MSENKNSCHFVPLGGGCQGNGSAYWSATYWDSTGHCVIANGLTEDEARKKAEGLLVAREKFIAMSPMEKLDVICAKGQICSGDMETAIRCIHKILKNA